MRRHFTKWATSQGRNLLVVRKTDRTKIIDNTYTHLSLSNVPCHFELSHMIKYSDIGNVIITKPGSSAIAGVFENKGVIVERNAYEMVLATKIPYSAIMI